MKCNQRYYWWVLPFALLFLVSCTQQSKQKKMNRRATFWRKDKIPYGTYYAFENLRYVFPNAEITVNTKSPEDNKLLSSENADQADSGKEKKLYLIISPEIVPDQSELNAMMNFIGQGNHLFIVSDYFGDSLMSGLDLRQARNMGFFFRKDSLSISLHNPLNWDSAVYRYPGVDAQGYASQMDSVYATVLGRDSAGRANFVRFVYKSGGSIYVHFTQVAFSNFFLLHRNNKEYYDQVFSYLPNSITHVIWDDYFRKHRSSDFSAFRFLLSNKSLRWAFWILLFLFGMIYLFESKRKQRTIPELPPMNNSSLDFVKTIGRLYYQRRDNGNLASKISSLFLDHVRTRYNISTSEGDEVVAEKLSHKTNLGRKS